MAAVVRNLRVADRLAVPQDLPGRGRIQQRQCAQEYALPEPDEPVIDTRSPACRLKSVGWSNGTWRRSSRRARARVSISALMDAVFLSIRMMQW